MIDATLRAVPILTLAILAWFELATAAMAWIWVPGGAGGDVQALWLLRAAGYAWAGWGLARRQPAAWPLAAVLFGLIHVIRDTPLSFLNDHDTFRPALASVGLAALLPSALATMRSARRRRATAASA